MDDINFRSSTPELRPLVPLDGGSFIHQILMIYTEELLIEITKLKGY